MIPIAEFAHSPAFAWPTAELERSGSSMLRARSSCRRKREGPTPGDQAVRAPDGTVRAVRSESETLPRLAGRTLRQRRQLADPSQIRRALISIHIVLSDHRVHVTSG
jgi:hypothetical protein